MKMIQNVCIFLTVALIVVSIVLTVITKWYIQLCRQWEDEGNRIETLKSDNRQLISDKRDLIARNEILYEDNVKLADAVKELRAINKELLSFEENEESAEEKGLDKSAAGVLPLPDKPTNIISIEDCYSPAFTPDTPQGQLQNVCHTDRDSRSPFQGARYYEYEGHRAYCTAISSNYAKEIGTVFAVELENGFMFYVIAADYKNSLDDPRKDWYGTPCRNHDKEDAVCIIELLSDLNELDFDTKYHGTFTAQEELGGLHGHGGNIKRLTKIGRWWEP